MLREATCWKCPTELSRVFHVIYESAHCCYYFLSDTAEEKGNKTKENLEHNRQDRLFCIISGVPAQLLADSTGLSPYAFCFAFLWQNFALLGHNKLTVGRTVRYHITIVFIQTSSSFIVECIKLYSCCHSQHRASPPTSSLPTHIKHNPTNIEISV